MPSNMEAFTLLIDKKIEEAKIETEKATNEYTQDKRTFADVRYYFGKLQAFEEIKEELTKYGC